jgi:predicted nucleic acid-binding protein
MKYVVLDASVAAKWYVREADSDAAEKLIESNLQFIAPDIFLAEVVNALLKQHSKAQLEDSDVRLAMETLLRAGVELVASISLLPRAVELALILNHTIYDCLYLALAELRDAILVTADRRFRDKAQDWQARIMMLAEIDRIV